MILQLGIGLAVVILTTASALGNWQHLSKYGLSVSVMVIAAEMLKPLLPIALIHHSDARRSGQWIATLTLWCIIVAFSAVNTFGNAIVRHAQEKVKNKENVAHVARAEHVIKADIANVQTCADIQYTEKQGKRVVKMTRTDTQCAERRKAKIDALESEMAERRTRESTNTANQAHEHTVTDGYAELLLMWGYNPRRWQIDVWVVLLWTALAEVGSALGGLCIPRKKRSAT